MRNPVDRVGKPVRECDSGLAGPPIRLGLLELDEEDLGPGDSEFTSLASRRPQDPSDCSGDNRFV